MEKIKIEHTFDILPHEHVESSVDEYALFLKEYKNSNKYRLIFSFNPICSNVLFNTITEIVDKNGKLINGMTKEELTSYNIEGPLDKYLEYTGRDEKYITKEEMINDTAYSHSEIGGFEYHCGYDIFDNHILRSKEFVVVNKLGKTDPNKTVFNTLTDYLRDGDGGIKSEKDMKVPTEETEFDKHLYTSDSVMSYHASINENLNEENGWLGFINKGNLQIPNVILDDKEITVNKVINNQDIGKFIDMYPDRSLYSILPKYNALQKRYEDNWVFCLTYPHSNDSTHALVSEQSVGYNGLECKFKLYESLFFGVDPDTKIITLRTFVEHGLTAGDKFRLAYFYEHDDGTISSGETINTCSVIETGSNEYEKTQYMKTRFGDVYSLIYELYMSLNFDSGSTDSGTSYYFTVTKKFFENKKLKFRFRRVVGNEDCKYYLRKFKKLKKRDGSDYSYTLNKLAFSKNVYGDSIGEIIYDNIIDVSDIRNNLGMPLSEIFISVFKTNYGHEQWYAVNNSGDTSLIETSHCFGKITSGFDMPSDENCVDYNIHKLHNIPTGDTAYTYDLTWVPIYASPLEDDITIKDTNEYYGDLVEFHEGMLTERVLEDVYYRFNTEQRETLNTTFADLKYHEIVRDDYDVNNVVEGNKITGFTVEAKSITDIDIDRKNSEIKVAANLNPEGYYYKPHYRVQLKEYLPDVYWGTDTLMGIHEMSDISNSGDTGVTKYKIECDRTYYMSIYDKIYLVEINNPNNIVYGYITASSGKTYEICFNKELDTNKIIEEVDGVNKLSKSFRLFKVNPLRPNNAYLLPDASGIYEWREFKGFNDMDFNETLYNRPFTNGTHYLHENINLYLKRQDPFGLYGLSFDSKTPFFKTNLIIFGNEKDVNNKEYIKNTEPDLC